jgi:hypothetical protein
MHRIVTTPELREGDIVRHHGMRLLIDREIKPSRSHPGTSTFWTDALVLNRDEVTSAAVPFGWTLQPDGTHRWNIQGNELARWYVEEASA